MRAPASPPQPLQFGLDPSSPVPLYHQLAEALRYRIATGALPHGTRLPSLRDAADLWKVNLHTVRHAYATLTESGLVRMDKPQGTVVLDAAADTAAAERFLDRVIRQWESRFGFTPEDLGRLLADRTARRPPPRSAVVVECSEAQAEDLAIQLASQCRVDVAPWSLERPGDPPDTSLIVATYFHYNDIRRRWPRRMAEIQFAAIRPDPSLATRLARTGDWPAARVVVCERDETMAASVIADLRGILPPSSVRLEAFVDTDPSRALQARRLRGAELLFPPRVWARLTGGQRASPRVHQVRYVFEAADLAVVRARLEGEPPGSVTRRPLANSGPALGPIDRERFVRVRSSA